MGEAFDTPAAAVRGGGLQMDDALLLQTLERRAERRMERRDFFRSAGAVAAGAAGVAALSACGGGHSSNSNSGSTTTPTSAPVTTVTDADVLNFALNLEYLEAQFYSYAVNGTGLAAASLTGTGTQGAVTDTGAGKVPFSDPVVAAYAREIAGDEANHVNFLRAQLGNAAVAQPAIDISVSPTSAFSLAAQAAGLAPAGTAFSPYASDTNFLLGAFIFEDVGVTAYKGASPLISNKTYLQAAAGILAAEAYHASLIRTSLFSKGVQTPALLSSAQAISDARDSLDGPSDDDLGLGTTANSTLWPGDANSIAFSRSTGQVLNIVYLTKAAAMKGGFFPNGVNGTVNTSAASG